MNGQRHTVIGVTPEGFSGVSALVAPELWLPFGLFGETAAAFGEAPKSRDLSDPKNYCMNLMGRMQPGVTMKSAQAQLPPLAAQLASVDASGSGKARDLVLAKPFGINTAPGNAGPLRLVGLLLLCMSGIVLLIGCLNLANMMLARGSARAPEIAVRLALGSTRGQIMRQLLTEGIVLAAIGGALGLLLSLWANSFLQNFFVTEFASFNLNLTAQLRPDFVVVTATFVLCLIATLLFSLGPALRAARADLVHDLKGQPGDAAVAGRWNRFFSGRHVVSARGDAVRRAGSGEACSAPRREIRKRSTSNDRRSGERTHLACWAITFLPRQLVAIRESRIAGSHACNPWVTIAQYDAH